jgi:signal transduction histidine kinase
VGIPEENLKKIFRVDKNISTIGTAKEKGTGLGLVLCKELVEKNSGTITADSKLNEGTTFTVSLPAAF